MLPSKENYEAAVRCDAVVGMETDENHFRRVNGKILTEREGGGLHREA